MKRLAAILALSFLGVTMVPSQAGAQAIPKPKPIPKPRALPTPEEKEERRRSDDRVTISQDLIDLEAPQRSGGSLNSGGPTPRSNAGIEQSTSPWGLMPPFDQPLTAMTSTSLRYGFQARLELQCGETGQIVARYSFVPPQGVSFSDLQRWPVDRRNYLSSLASGRPVVVAYKDGSTSSIFASDSWVYLSISQVQALRRADFIQIDGTPRTVRFSGSGSANAIGGLMQNCGGAEALTDHSISGDLVRQSGGPWEMTGYGTAVVFTEKRDGFRYRLNLGCNRGLPHASVAIQPGFKELEALIGEDRKAEVYRAIWSERDAYMAALSGSSVLDQIYTVPDIDVAYKTVSDKTLNSWSRADKIVVLASSSNMRLEFSTSGATQAINSVLANCAAEAAQSGTRR